VTTPPVPATDPPATDPPGERPAITAGLTRGMRRALADRGFATLAEMWLPNGRRADVFAFDEAGCIWIVEIKSGVPDFLADQKWQAYRDYCDAFAFAVTPDFPQDRIPGDCGLFVADAFGAVLVREPPVAKLPAARRKSLLIAAAGLAARRLHRIEDPTHPSGGAG